MSNTTFDPQSVNLDTADPAQVVCYLELGDNGYNGHLGERISALFVILVISTAGTFFPVLATHFRRLKIPLYVYLFARYFGAGVIIATAFIHLLDPAYGEIGPNTCVGMSGNWVVYSWPPAIVLTSVMMIFLLDFLAEYYVEVKYGMPHGPTDRRPEIEDIITEEGAREKERSAQDPNAPAPASHSHQFLHSADQDPELAVLAATANRTYNTSNDNPGVDADSKDNNSMKLAELGILSGGDSEETNRAFREQIAAFLILEFGVIFHSVIIGLNLGVAGNEFYTLYPVLVFHQTFEGLGIGSRLSVIPFPSRLRWMPWILCAGYGLTTPISIAIGLGLRHTYNGNSYTANIVSGVLDSVSAGILIYTGLVEMLARDFLFNPTRTMDKTRLGFMLVTLYVGAGVMALLGKWA